MTAGVGLLHVVGQLVPGRGYNWGGAQLFALLFSPDSFSRSVSSSSGGTSSAWKRDWGIFSPPPPQWVGPVFNAGVMDFMRAVLPTLVPES